MRVRVRVNPNPNPSPNPNPNPSPNPNPNPCEMQAALEAPPTEPTAPNAVLPASYFRASPRAPVA